MIKEIRIPEVGEKIESGQVVNILVSRGDTVKVDDGIIEFETDKAVVEIPSPDAGRITEVLVKDGDTVKIGAVIAKIDTQGKQAAKEQEKSPKQEEAKAAEETPPAEEPEEEPTSEEVAEEDEGAEEAEEPKEVEEEEKAGPAGRREPTAAKKSPPSSGAAALEDMPPLRRPAPASPSVRRLARQLGADIYEVQGTGPNGRITMDDVKAYVKQIVTASTETGTGPVRAAGGQLPDFSRWGSIRREDISTIRRVTAESTAVSWNTVPHVTQFDRADITSLMEFIDRHGKSVEKAGGKLTVTAVLLKVMALGLRKFPRFNASLDVANGQLIYKDYVHIGMAVDTERGLLVPVLRDVDTKSITDLAVELKQLAERTRNKKVKPDELEGGTFTISNQGSIGGTNFTPIVLWPQAAILGVSRSTVEPVFIDGEFEARTILPLSLSYDHRIVDGADAARFLKWVTEALENPFVLHLD